MSKKRKKFLKKRRVYKIRGKVVSKEKYEEQMKAIHSKDNQKKGSGKKRFRLAQQINNERKLSRRKIDYKRSNKKTINISSDKLDDKTIDEFENWKNDQGNADIRGIDTKNHQEEKKEIEESFVERPKQYDAEDIKEIAIELQTYGNKGYSNQNDRNEAQFYIIENQNQLKEILGEDSDLEYIINSDSISYKNREIIDNVRKKLWRKYYSS